MKFKLGRFGFRIGHKYYGSSTSRLLITSPDTGTWFRFFPGFWWQTVKPFTLAKVSPIHTIKNLPKCIGKVLIEADLDWVGKKCDWQTLLNTSSCLWCGTCGEVRDSHGAIIVISAIQWQREHPND